jgi:hypothetical protein
MFMSSHPVMVPARTFKEAVNGLVARPEEKAALLARVAELKLDGRKIRNMVRAIQLNRTKELTWDVIEFLWNYIAFGPMEQSNP